MKLRIVILPNANISRKAGAWAKKIVVLGKHDFVVDNKNLLPHITLCVVEASPANVDELIGQVKKTVSKFKPINLTLSKFRIYEDIWFAWEVKSSAELTKLRNAIYREVGKMPNVQARVRNPYEPHITLTRFAEKLVAQKALAVCKETPKALKASIIAITYDKDTQVPEVIKSFKLK